MKDFKKLIREAHLGNPLNEIKPTPVSGTKSGATYSLDSDREIILKKDVKGAKIGDFINITLPKGTIIYNLPGGVFAKHKDLDDMFGGRNVRKDAKYGFSVIRSRDTLAAIEDAANLEESLNDDILDEDMNDPVLVKARAAKMADEKEMAKQASLDKKYGSNFMDKLDAEIGLKNELQDLKDERAQLMIDMEQEAEPEGGEIADEYGSRLNDIDARMGEIKPELEDLRMYESVVTESKGAMNYFSDLKSNYQKAFRYLDVKEREEYKRLAKDFFSKLQVDDKVRAVGLNEDSYIRVSKPRFKKDKNNPNFLYVYMDYDTGPGGSSIALGKETMTGQIRRLSSAEAVRQMNDIAKKLNDNFNIEDIEVKDLENGKVQIFAVSDDFIDMDPRSELSMALLNESASTEEKRIATRAIKSIAKYRGVSEDEAKRDLTRAIEQLGSLKEAIKDIKETIKLGKTLNEELCAKGKAYRKRRIAAGEKSSAYLSGRAVKVCKGQMSGKKKKK